MTGEQNSGRSDSMKRRLALGGAVLAVGFLAPLFIPLVMSSELSPEWKATLSGLLLLGIPEVFMLAAVAITGKEGFESLKRLLMRLFRKHLAPPATVSPLRYRIGLAMFLLPLLFGWLAPYVADAIPGYKAHRIEYSIFGDLLFVASLFVLGGNFWDKLQSLLIREARVELPGRPTRTK